MSKQKYRYIGDKKRLNPCMYQESRKSVIPDVACDNWCPGEIDGECPASGIDHNPISKFAHLFEEV